MQATDWIVIIVVFGILAACIVFDLWVRNKENNR